MTRYGPHGPPKRRTRPFGLVFAWLALLTAALSPLACSKTTSPETGLMIIINTDMTPMEYDSIRVEVSQEEGAGSGQWHKWEDEDKSVPQEVTLPATVFVRSGQAADQDALIQVTAYLMGQAVVLREAQLQIPTDRVAELRLVLAERCKGQVQVLGAEGEPMSTCVMAGQSCQPDTGMCGDTTVPASSLPSYNPMDVTPDAADISRSSGSSSGGSSSSGASSSGAGSGVVVGSSSGSSGGSGVSGSDAGGSGSGMPGASSSGAGSSGGSGDAGNSGSGTPGANSSGASGSGDGGPEAGSSGGGKPDGGSSGVSSSSSSSSSGGTTCTDACTAGVTKCAPPVVQTCERPTNGGCTQWVTTATCGAHQTCALTAGVASCQCDSTVCTEAGTVCQDAQTVTTCAAETSGCLYAASTKTCTAPESCAGASPAAACALTCTSTCTLGQSTCVGASVETCIQGNNGCLAYGPATACGAHQTCTGAAPSAACTCNTDPVCSAVGPTCANTSTLANCAQDAQGCFYEATASTCTNGACSAGACCTNACTSGVNACLATSSTEIQSCAVGANGCTAQSTSACAAGLVCERYGSPACVDPTWAEWSMPNGEVDVTAGAPNLESYTDNGNGTVTDNVTGLVWEQTAPATTYTQAAAIAYCAGLSLAGYTDWRLPSKIELFSIVDPSTLNPSINATVFPGTAADPFWSSTPYASGGGWYVDFVYGGSFGGAASVASYARCVR